MLISECGTENASKLAASYVYWIPKLKPILNISIEGEDVDEDDEDKDQFKRTRINFFKIHINEYFAYHLATGIMDAYLCESSAKDVVDAKMDAVTSYKRIENFVHILKYKQIQPEPLALMFEVWFT